MQIKRQKNKTIETIFFFKLTYSTGYNPSNTINGKKKKVYITKQHVIFNA